MDEEYLVHNSKKGDKSAFASLIGIYQNKLYRTAYGILGSSQDAYDALQESILEAYISVNTLRNDYYFKYWINKILVNSCNDILRHKKKVIYIEDSVIPDETEDYDVSSIDIKISLSKLESKYRSLISLRYYQDLSYEDIAEILNCPVGTVKSRISYALKKLKDVMDKSGLMEVRK